MRIIILTWMILISSIAIFAQNYVLFKNGATLEYDKSKFLKGAWKVTLPDHTEKIFDENEIDGFIYSKKEKVKYVRKLSLTAERPTEIEKDIEGSINVYHFQYLYSGGGSNTEWYLEKGGYFEMILELGDILPGKESKLARIQTLKKLMSDQPKIIQELDGDDFKPKIKNLINLISKYNTLNFDSLKIDHKSLTNCIFYLRSGDEIGTLAVNDSQVQKISSKLPSVFKASHTTFSKVCLKIDEVNSCGIIKLIPHFVNYFEVSRDGDKITIERINSRVAQSHILYNRNNESKK
jgi:hypothetical protein